jgi:DNA-binding response OmpR family regulator
MRDVLMRILIIEDEARLADMIARVLSQERYEVDIAHDGNSGLELALTGSYDALILDRMLPGRDGLAIVQLLREEEIGTPVLMLTALGDLTERVEGLDAGADDYLGKPFAFEELLARLRALTRRTDRPILGQAQEFGGLVVNLPLHEVSRDGEEIALSPREFALLETFVRNRGRVLTRDQLLERVWGYEAEPQGNVVDLYVHYLRRKLEAPGSDPLIRTIRGTGYILPADH